MPFTGRDIISVTDLSMDEICEIFTVADRMLPYARRELVTEVLQGAVLSNLFFEPSTRTRLSFGSAFNRLGGSSRDTTGFSITSISKGESLYDTARVVSGYSDVIVMRHPQAGAVQEIADAVNIPVINGGDGPREHPSQALLDYYTLCREMSLQPGDLSGLTITFVGDMLYGRTVHSFAQALSGEKNINFRFVAPKQLQVPDWLQQKLRQNGHIVTICDSVIDGVQNANVVYSTRVQEERFLEGEGKIAFDPAAWRVDRNLITTHCRPDVVVMHPLPRDSRVGPSELSIDLNDHKNLAIFRQADNGIPIRMALFALTLGVADQVDQYARKATWFVPPRLGVNDPLGLYER